MSGEGHPYREPPPPLRPPPRRVPTSVRLVLALGGFKSLVGWAAVVGASALFWGIAIQDGSFINWSDSRFVPATVTALHHVDRPKPHQEIDFSFIIDGQTHSVRASTWDRRVLDTSAAFDIEVPRGHAEFACVRGFECRYIGPHVLVIPLAIAIVGCVFVVGAVRLGRRAATLLRDGEVTSGRLVEKQPTSVKAGGRTVWQMRFAFETADGERRFARALTDVPRVFEDEPTEQILYLPSEREMAAPVDHLPGRPRVDRDGHIAPATRRNVALVLMLPTLAVLANVVGVSFALLQLSG